LALMGSATRGSTLHIHAYLDHDHPEHHHGLAAHEHHRAISHRDEHHDSRALGETELQLDSCDPGTHAVTVVTRHAQLPQVHVIDGVCATPTILAGLMPLTPVAEPTDVRVHGPPSHVRIPSRAPPATLHA
jgi:hypothetical protein